MRGNLNNKWLATMYVTFVLSSVLIYSKIQTDFTVYIKKREKFKTDEKSVAGKSSSYPFQKMTESYLSSQHQNNNSKHVTKSLTELGKMDEISKHFLFLNSVPKCGSEILILLLQKLQGLNNFRHVRLKDGNKRKLSRLQQETLVYEMYDVIRSEAVPLSFDRTVYFINFTTFDKQSPTFLNLIRDPVDKVMSRMPAQNNRTETYNYFLKCSLKRKNGCIYQTGKSYDLTIPYFCGHDARCMVLNDDWALQTAKTNVERYYPVVGVLEELNATLEVLESKVPYFFKGVQMAYHQNILGISKKKTNMKVPISIRKKLEEALVNEMDFYNWIKSRLFKQLQILYGDHHQNH